jgi:hypothetical protein
MRRFIKGIDKALDDVVDWFWARLGRLPGSALAVIAVASYGGMGLAVPLALGWSAGWLVFANVWGATFAFLAITVWIGMRVQERDRRHLLEWTTDLRRLDAQEFEWLVGETYRRFGWAITERGRQGAADGNVDVELRRGSDRRVVQVKAWARKQVGVEVVRELAGTAAAEGLAASAGVIVTLSSFTPAAREEAGRTGLKLIDGADLYAMVEQVRAGEPCPNCQSSMRLGNNEYGWWWRCVKPNCGGKRPLTRYPGLAVEMLTKQPQD